MARRIVREGETSITTSEPTSPPPVVSVSTRYDFPERLTARRSNTGGYSPPLLTRIVLEWGKGDLVKTLVRFGVLVAVLAALSSTGCGSGVVARTGVSATPPTLSASTIFFGTPPTLAVPPTTSSTPHPATPEPTTGAVALTPTPADLTDFAKAYVQLSRYNACPVQAVASTFMAAVVQATGTGWAFGQLEPKPGCSINDAGQAIDARTAFPFGAKPYDTGVFEKQPGGAWVMNWWESSPFPCPDNTAVPQDTPGHGHPFVPTAVLTAVGVPFAAGCDTNLYVPPYPRGMP
jgi:hypothetical protein